VIQCLGNNSFYVGSSNNMKRRLFKEHLPAIRRNKHFNAQMQRAWRKYGEDSFLFIPVAHCDSGTEAEYLILEQLMLDTMKTSDLRTMNSSAVVTSPMAGRSHTAETKAKITARATGVRCSPETRAKMSASRKGVQFSPEHRAALSAFQRGMPKSPEHRAALSVAHSGVARQPLSLEHRTKLAIAAVAQHTRKRAALALSKEQ
jgi:group I intron endonuclease